MVATPEKFAEKYFDFDEIEDVLTSLDLIALLAIRVQDKPSYWKWIIISAHSALQGAMVCAFADSTGTSILTKKSAQEMLDFLCTDKEQRGEYPKEWLAPFDELLERCRQGSPISAPLVLSAEELGESAQEMLDFLCTDKEQRGSIRKNGSGAK